MDVMMGVEIVGAVAPGAEILIFVIQPSRGGFYKAIVAAAERGVSILAITSGVWEAADSKWQEQIEQALAFAVCSGGVTVVCASGDAGSTPSPYHPEKPEPCYPACSAWVVGCGGTTIQGWQDDAQPDEIVWNEAVLSSHRGASGGGFSAGFDDKHTGRIGRPPWQTDVLNDGRGVPDIAANAAIQSGVWLWFGDLPAAQRKGINAISFGTSASTPLLAGLLARVSLGWGGGIPRLNSALYQPAVRAAMRPIVTGNNAIQEGVSLYQAGPGWNPCAGLGRPVGTLLLEALRPYVT
jgi:kumamolisin